MSYAYDNNEFSHYYDTFVAEHVPRDAFWIDTANDIYAEIIQRTFVDNQRTSIVDLGCGTGDDLIYFANKFNNRNIQLIGIDHSQAMLDRAKEKVLNQSNHLIAFLHGDLTNFASRLETRPVDCILLPAGTFHHLITDNERQELINNVRQTLRPSTGLFGIYLMPDSFIHINAIDTSNKEEKLKLVAIENLRENDNSEWICKQIFEFNVPPKIELSWQLRTCQIPKLIQLFISNNFEPIFYCLNGKDLQSYTNEISLSLNNHTTPVILVFRTIKNTN